MVNFKRITLTTISYVTEDHDLVNTALMNCIPLSEQENNKPKQQIIQSQFGDRLIFLELEIRQNIDRILKYWQTQLDDKSKAYLGRHIKNKIDLNRKHVHFRFDKFQALNEKLVIQEGSDVVKVSLKYEAFTQNQNQMENVVNMLSTVGIMTS